MHNPDDVIRVCADSRSFADSHIQHLTKSSKEGGQKIGLQGWRIAVFRASFEIVLFERTYAELHIRHFDFVVGLRAKSII